MEVFEWIRHVLATTTPSIEFESLLVVLVKYGVTSDQTASGIPIPHNLFQIDIYLCIADLAIMCI